MFDDTCLGLFKGDFHAGNDIVKEVLGLGNNVLLFDYLLIQVGIRVLFELYLGDLGHVVLVFQDFEQ